MSGREEGRVTGGAVRCITAGTARATTINHSSVRPGDMLGERDNTCMNSRIGCDKGPLHDGKNVTGIIILLLF